MAVDTEVLFEKVKKLLAVYGTRKAIKVTKDEDGREIVKSKNTLLISF